MACKEITCITPDGKAHVVQGIDPGKGQPCQCPEGYKQRKGRSTKVFRSKKPKT